MGGAQQQKWNARRSKAWPLVPSVGTGRWQHATSSCALSGFCAGWPNAVHTLYQKHLSLKYCSTNHSLACGALGGPCGGLPPSPTILPPRLPPWDDRPPPLPETPPRAGCRGPFPSALGMPLALGEAPTNAAAAAALAAATPAVGTFCCGSWAGWAPASCCVPLTAAPGGGPPLPGPCPCPGPAPRPPYPSRLPPLPPWAMLPLGGASPVPAAMSLAGL